MTRQESDHIATEIYHAVQGALEFAHLHGIEQAKAQADIAYYYLLFPKKDNNEHSKP